MIDPIPSQPTKKRVYFSLEAPNAKEVILCGSFNNWDINARRLRQDKMGIWRTFRMLAPDTYEYRFLVDGEWQNGPKADVIENAYGTYNCVVVVK